ncbi:SDR family oxidoreductase [Agromyces sp. Root81]|uniref:SDR family oxidoreductase n=1 Tax=Agromyces sp. Root81 TaxID=1736601 RepID=UPI001910F39F|nr:SDR family oxidoreductase [Agromyces sp. Root81]
MREHVAVVTGGAGILGTETASALADHGARVAVVDVDVERATATASAIASEFDATVIGVACDVTDPASIAAATETIEGELGPISILHNNAATKGSDLAAMFAPVEEYSLDTWREIMAVNLDGLFLVSRHIGGLMADRKRGSIIHTSSIYGSMGPDQRIYEGSEYLGRAINTPPVYSASKGGVIGLTLYLATYWAQAGVRVNALTPGGIASGQNEEFARRYSARVPLGRMAEAREVAAGLLFLASDASSYITGQNLHVDGGLSAW